MDEGRERPHVDWYNGIARLGKERWSRSLAIPQCSSIPSIHPQALLLSIPLQSLAPPSATAQP